MSCLLENLFFISRRIIFVVTALNFDQSDNYYVAIFAFNVLSFMKITLLIVVRPFRKTSMNYIEAVNETFIFCLGTIARILQD